MEARNSKKANKRCATNVQPAGHVQFKAELGAQPVAGKRSVERLRSMPNDGNSSLVRAFLGLDLAPGSSRAAPEQADGARVVAYVDMARRVA